MRGCTSRADSRSILMPQPKLKSEKGTFPLKPFQFEFAERTHRCQFSQFYVRGFAKRARLAYRTSKFFQSKDQIYFASHQAFFAHRCDAASRDRPKVNNEAKLRPFFSLQFFE